MGYANIKQTTGGIHLRQYSRAFVIIDQIKSSRIIYVNVDICMISQLITLEVVKVLKQKYPGLYNERNVLLASTHTHSGPGGFLQYFLYNIPTNGFVKQCFQAILSGIILVN